MEVHHSISKLPQPGYGFYSIARRKSEQLIMKVQTKSWTIHPNSKSIQELTTKIINYYYIIVIVWQGTAPPFEVETFHFPFLSQS